MTRPWEPRSSLGRQLDDGRQDSFRAAVAPRAEQTSFSKGGTEVTSGGTARARLGTADGLTGILVRTSGGAWREGGEWLRSLGSATTILQGEMADTGTRISSVESSTSTLVTQMSDAGSRLTAVEGTTSTLWTQMSSAGSRLSSLEGDMAGAGSRLSSLEGDMGSAGSRLSGLETSRTTHAGLLSGLRADVDGKASQASVDAKPSVTEVADAIRDAVDGIRADSRSRHNALLAYLNGNFTKTGTAPSPPSWPAP